MSDETNEPAGDDQQDATAAAGDAGDQAAQSSADDESRPTVAPDGEPVVPPAPADTPPGAVQSEGAGSDGAVVPPAPADTPPVPDAAPASVAPPAAGAIPPPPPASVPGAPVAVAAGQPAGANPWPGTTAPADVTGAAPPPGPPVPPAGRSWFAAFTAQHLLGGLAHVGIAVGAAVGGGLVLTLALLAAGASDDSMTNGVGVSVDQVLSGAGAFFGLILTLAGVVFGGEVTVTLGADGGFVQAAGGGSLWLFPLTLTVGAMIAVLWWGVRTERARPLPTRWHRLAHGAAVGLVAALVLLLLTFVFSLRSQTPALGAGGAGAQLAITAAGYRVVLFGTLLVGAAAFLGRSIGTVPVGGTWVTAARAWLSRIPRVFRELLAYATAGAVVFGLIGTVFTIFQLWSDAGPGSILVGVLGILNIAPLVAALAHLGGVSAVGAVAGTGNMQTATLPGIGEPLPWLLLLVALLLSVVVAVWIGTRRSRAAGIDWKVSWQLPTAVFGAWIVLGTVFFGLGVAAAGSAGIFGGSVTGGFGVAPWTAFVMLVWAALVELGAQTLPRLVYGISPKLHAVLAGRRAVEAWAAGPAAAATPAVAGAPAAGLAAGTAPVAPGPVPAGAPAAALPAPAPLSPAAKRGLIIGGIAVGAVVVLAVLGGIALSVVNGMRSPEATVKTYLDHVASGDAAAANAMVDPDVPSAEREFLTNEVMAAAVERITDVEVRRLGSGGSDTYVDVTYKLDGVAQNEQLRVTKGDPEWLVLDTWKVRDSVAQPARLYQTGPGVATIGGVEVPIGTEDYGSTEVYLYPGVYEVTAADSRYFELADTTVAVGGMMSDMVELAFTPTEELTVAVQKEVDALVAGCVKQTVAEPEGCPFRVYTSGDPKVTWTSVDIPAVEIMEQDPTRFRARDGLARAVYTEEFFGSSYNRDDDVRYDIDGTVRIDGDTVAVEFEDSWW